MSRLDYPLSFTSADRPDYLPQPPRLAEWNARATWSRAIFLAGLLLAPPGVLYLGQTSGGNWRALVKNGSPVTGVVLPRD